MSPIESEILNYSQDFHKMALNRVPIHILSNDIYTQIYIYIHIFYIHMNQSLFFGMSLLCFVSFPLPQVAFLLRFAQSDSAKLENDKGEELLLGEVGNFVEWLELQVSNEKRAPGCLGSLDIQLPCE